MIIFNFLEIMLFQCFFISLLECLLLGVEEAHLAHLLLIKYGGKIIKILVVEGIDLVYKVLQRAIFQITYNVS